MRRPVRAGSHDDDALRGVTKMQISCSPASVCAATVTYGRRWHLLGPLLDALVASGVGRVVVVDNGSQEDVSAAVSDRFGDQVEVARLPRNTGSAGGFATAIGAASETDSEFIWLLDDDNLPAPDALERLCDAYRYLGGIPENALLAFRPLWPQQRRVLWKGPRLATSANRFLGSAVADLPSAFRRRLLGRREWSESALPPYPLAALEYAPYGGLFMHRSWVGRIGIPDPRWFLYQDDSEYTRRIVECGGRIYLCATARVEDSETSWSEAAGRIPPLFSPLLPDWRVYYAARNLVALERRFITNRILYGMNAATVLIGSVLLALLVRSNPRHVARRLRLILRAVAAGRRGDFTVPEDILSGQEGVAVPGPVRDLSG